MARSIRRPLLIGVALVAVLVGAGAWLVLGIRDGDKAAREKARFTYVKTERRDLQQTVVINGTIAPALATELRSEVSGRVRQVLVSAGDRVEAKQPLVELDQRDFQVRTEEANLGIEAARLRAERAELEYARLKPLAAQAFVNERDYKEAEISRDLARNELAAQQARLRLLETALERSTVVAPYAGTVLSVAARPGMVVTGADSGFEGRVVLELADLTRLRVEAAINEIDVAVLALNQPVEITFESVRDLKAEGRLSYIAPAAGKAADGTTINVKPREYPVQIAIDTADPRILPGMTARVRIETARAQGALALPSPVVFYDFEKDEAYVYVRTAPEGAKGEALTEPERTRVTLGVRDSDWVEITSGLVEGREVSRQSPPPLKDNEATRTQVTDEEA